VNDLDGLLEKIIVDVLAYGLFVFVAADDPVGDVLAEILLSNRM